MALLVEAARAQSDQDTDAPHDCRFLISVQLLQLYYGKGHAVVTNWRRIIM